MLVKCKKCHKELERDNAYKVVVGGRNAYYCSKDEYDLMIESREQKDEIYKIYIPKILGHDTRSTVLYKEMNDLFSIYDISLVHKYLQKEEESISAVMQSKNFQSEYAEIRYFSAILKNHLTDFKRNAEEEIEIPVIEYNHEDVNIKFKRKKKRKTLEEIENNI